MKTLQKACFLKRLGQVKPSGNLVFLVSFLATGLATSERKVLSKMIPRLVLPSDKFA